MTWKNNNTSVFLKKNKDILMTWKNNNTSVFLKKINIYSCLRNIIPLWYFSK